MKNEFIEQCEKDIYWLIAKKGYRFCEDWAAEDFVQNCLEWLVKKGLQTYDPQKAQFNTWFISVCKNMYAKQYNKYMKGREERFVRIDENRWDSDNNTQCILDTFCSSESAEAVYANEWAKHELLDLVKLLPEKRRKAVELVDLLGYKVADAAKALHCKPAEVSDSLYRGHQALKKLIEEKHLAEEFEQTIAA